MTCLWSHGTWVAEAGVTARSLDPEAVPCPLCLALLARMEMVPGSEGRQADPDWAGWSWEAFCRSGPGRTVWWSDSRDEGVEAGM